MVSQDHQGLGDNQVLRVVRDHREHLDLPALLEPQGQQVRQVQQGSLDKQALRDPKDPEVSRAVLDNQDPEET